MYSYWGEKFVYVWIADVLRVYVFVHKLFVIPWYDWNFCLYFVWHILLILFDNKKYHITLYVGDEISCSMSLQNFVHHIVDMVDQSLRQFYIGLYLQEQLRRNERYKSDLGYISLDKWFLYLDMSQFTVTNR